MFGELQFPVIHIQVSHLHFFEIKPQFLACIQPFFARHIIELNKAEVGVAQLMLQGTLCFLGYIKCKFEIFVVQGFYLALQKNIECLGGCFCKPVQFFANSAPGLILADELLSYLFCDQCKMLEWT